MSGTTTIENRQTIPRGINYRIASSLGMLGPLQPAKGAVGKRIVSSKIVEDWQYNPNISSAIDIVSEAIIIQDSESNHAAKAAKYLISNAPENLTLVRELAHHFLETPQIIQENPNSIISIPMTRERVRTLRNNLRLNPINPIAWADLALLFATLEIEKKARSSMEVALNLGKQNRFVLRSASRVFTHFKEPDRAMSILEKSNLCSSDPWITSAEIAIAEGFGLKSKCLPKSRRLIQDDNLSVFSRSELMAGLATIEYKSGALKKAKKLMNQVLESPTENALAQVGWLSNEIGINLPAIQTIGNTLPAAFEAKAMYSYYDAKFDESLEAGTSWGIYQPLSSKPILHLAHITATFLDDDIQVLNILECTPFKLEG